MVTGNELFYKRQSFEADSPVNKEIQKIREIKKDAGVKERREEIERGRRMPRANIKIPEPERYGRAVSLLANRQC
jgi:hypothetical protein